MGEYTDIYGVQLHIIYNLFCVSLVQSLASPVSSSLYDFFLKKILCEILMLE